MIGLVSPGEPVVSGPWRDAELSGPLRNRSFVDPPSSTGGRRWAEGPVGRRGPGSVAAVVAASEAISELGPQSLAAPTAALPFGQ